MLPLGTILIEDTKRISFPFLLYLFLVPISLQNIQTNLNISLLALPSPLRQKLEQAFPEYTVSTMRILNKAFNNHLNDTKVPRKIFFRD